MEKQILNLLNFDLYSPNAIVFLKVYGKVLTLERRVFICSEYLADLMLLAVNTHLYQPSLLASAYLFISL
jgi:hypothetical protein